jgi:hypothetical protein
MVIIHVKLHYVVAIQHKLHVHMWDKQCIVDNLHYAVGINKHQHVKQLQIMEVWVQVIVMMEHWVLQDGQLLEVDNVNHVMGG